MQENVKVDLELVDKVREFIMTRWTINFAKRDKTAIPYETLGELIPSSEPITFSSVMNNLEVTMNDAYYFFIDRLDEFGADKAYVESLVDNEASGPNEVLEFVKKFKEESTPIN